MSVIILILIIMALPPAILENSPKRFVYSIIFSFAGILLPLFVFFVNGVLGPEWKGACRYGWLDCFSLGMLALSPLVLWACAAFYTYQILRLSGPPRWWVVLGLFSGVVVSSVCFVIGSIIHTNGYVFLVVPFYVIIWYSILWIRALKSSKVRFLSHIYAFLASLPFWAGSVILSRNMYQSLSEEPSRGCFVVTAALKGNRALVGPFMMIEHYGAHRVANRQLLRFWRFEALWDIKSPVTRRVFRFVYNRLGPVIAGAIRGTLAASLVYIALKPFEWLAAVCVALNGKENLLVNRRIRVAGETPGANYIEGDKLGKSGGASRDLRDTRESRDNRDGG